MPDERHDQRLQLVRDRYRASPWIEPRADESPLLRSWQRSEAAGLGAADSVSFELVRRSALAEIDDRYAPLIESARPETDRLAAALRRTSCSVLLVNERSVVIDRRIHEASASRPLQAVSRKGVNLDERCIGTTAPSISLHDGIPYLVGVDAHYADNNRPFFCVAAPIDDALGQRLGALSIVSYESVPDFDVLSLVAHAAAAVENGLMKKAPQRLVVQFHVWPELVGTAMEGLIAVDERQRIAGVNRTALRLLCTTRAALVGSDFRELMDLDLERALSRRDAAGGFEMRTRSGLHLHARLGWPAGAASAAPGPGPAPATLRDTELQLMRSTLAEVNGNMAAAARRLGISRSTLYRRLAEAS